MTSRWLVSVMTAIYETRDAAVNSDELSRRMIYLCSQKLPRVNTCVKHHVVEETRRHHTNVRQIN
jgi:hypothetical protein